MTNYQLLTAPAGLESTQRDLMRKNTTNILVAMVGAISALAFSATARADMGRTEGSWGVSPSGAATYSIPLWVQPGPKGMQPSLAFVYNSQGGNGTMGVGWALAGFSSIDRCASTILEDGADKGVTVDVTDRFCLGGNKLRITSGPLSSYGTVGAVYQTSSEEFSRITSVNSAGTGPQSFLVHTKSGLILEYGNTSNSRVVLSGSTVFRWMLNKVSDREGNSYAVTYTTGNTTGRVPLTVSWGQTTPGGATYQYQAAFNYSNKSNANDWVSARQGSSTIVTKQRLDSVTIGYSASGSSYATKRQYQLAYAAVSPTTGRTLLTSITECATTTSNCLKPTTMTYQSGQPGVSSTATSVPSVNGANASKFDFNGDGRNDLAFLNGTWRVAFSTGAGFTAPVDSGVSGSQLQIGRFVSARVDGFLYNSGGVWNYTAYNGASFVTTSTGVAVAAAGNLTTATDTNGDGLVDIIHSSTSLVGSSYFANVYVRLNTTTGAATVPSFSSSVYTALTREVGPNNGAINFLAFDVCPAERQCDINGDGAPDVNALVTTTFGCGPSGCSPVNTGYDMMSGGGVYTLVNSRAGVNAPFIGIRFNSDRCIDTIRFNTTTLRVNGCGTGATATVTLPAPYLTFLDWDGDGKSDEIVNNGGTIGVYKSTGSTTAGQSFSPLITTTIPYNSACKYYPADVDGDGLDELVCVTSTGTLYYSHNGNGSVGSGGGANVFATQIPDLLSSITDGYGLSVSPSYVSTAQSGYTKGSNTTLPLVDATDVMHLVGRMRVSDGIGTTYDLDYTYKGARRNSGRGNLDETVGADESGNASRVATEAPDGEWAGFEEISVVDSRNGMKNKTVYDQIFPLVGMIKTAEVLQADATRISLTTNTNMAESLDSTAGNQRYFTYVSQSVSDSYEVGGSLNGQPITSTTSTFGYSPFTYGNLTTYSTVVTDKDSTTTPSQYNSTWTTAITIAYEPALTSGSDWCVGFVNQTTIAQTSTASGVSPVTRIVGFTPDTSDPSKCRIKTKTIEPSSSQYRVTETYGFDAFGNINSKQVVGRQPLVGGGYGDMPTRTTSVDWGATGQFLVSSMDPLGAVSTFAYNPEDGTLKDAFDPNSTGSNIIKTSFQYDGFARTTRITRPNGTYTTFSFDDCVPIGCVYPTHKLTLKETDFDTAGGVITDRYTYRDSFGRIFVNRTRLLSGTTWDGSYQWMETQYDAQDRVYRQYLPCTTASATSSCRLHAITNSYDAKDRITQSSRPRSQSDSSPQSTSYAYAGRTRTTTDALGKVSMRVTDVAGSVRQVKDANNYAINIAHDAAGGVIGITDSEGATRLSGVNVQYGIQAFQVAATDSALGQQTRTYNSLGELIGWTNGNNHSFIATYDALSRPLTRVGTTSTTTWQWGNNSAEFNKGELRHVESTENGETYSEDYTYDYLSRPLRKSITIPGQAAPFDYDYAYDAGKGWLDTLTYPVSTSGYRMALKYAYQNGALQSVANANAPTTVYWAANSSNAFGQVTQDTIGNGIVRARTFDAVTARLSSIQSGVSGNPTSVQNLSFLYDLIGNVTQRQNNKLGLTETFYYGSGTDNLHRLAQSTLYDGSTTVTNLSLTYDKSGNILTKNELGLTEPLVNQSVTWTTYDYPAQITTGSETTSFAYGPDRQRWRMVYTDSGGTETTYYIGGLLEMVVVGGSASFRHTISAGGSPVAIYTRAGASEQLRYVLDDNQRSTESFVESATGSVTNSSFSAFGTRRNAGTWSGGPANAPALNAITRQGYTYQTVLGSMGLNHMKGRVQDAVNGRFLSADPYISDPEYTQNYNRYSYVTNNPLTFIDPTGFCQWPGQNNGSRYNDNPENKDPKKPGGQGSGNGSGNGNGNGGDSNDSSPCPIPEVVVTGHPSSSDSSAEIPVIVVCGNCSNNRGPDPFTIAQDYYRAGDALYVEFTASAGWGFNENIVTEYAGGPEIAFLAPWAAIQQHDPDTGNEELRTNLLIDILTGDIGYKGRYTVTFDEPFDFDQPATSLEPKMYEPPIVLPPPPTLVFEE
jgi:RHS repeat-associated protein